MRGKAYRVSLKPRSLPSPKLLCRESDVLLGRYETPEKVPETAEDVIRQNQLFGKYPARVSS